MDESKNLAKTYNPKEFESKIYKFWEKGKYFTPKADKTKKPFCIIMPPPNITGKLHLGHALDNALQDFLVRVKRMQGYSTLWLPGEDHASIATEVKVEKELLKEGLKKKEMGRTAFLKRVWQWSDEYRNNIRNQIKKMGCSADFTRESFTMDEKLSKAVRTVFVKMYNEGLIYHGNRITNWCPKCQTALSDAEIIYEEQKGHFWHIKYPIAGTDKFLEIATTRPETMLGDTAVAVNPKDDRYKDLVGKMLILPIVNKEIPVIADDYVDMEFGTGAVKITPAHDPNDYMVGKRHNLDEINILNNDGTINENGGKYAGMDKDIARDAIVKELKDGGYLVSIEDISHNVSCHDRCGTAVEPIISSQWYVKMESLAKPAIEAVKNNKTQFVPERFSKIYFNWMENIQDWCISRQLWWGHRIPVWYCKDCGEINVSIDDIVSCKKCGSHNLKQDEDVLDTWFSSALWPFSTLGWPDKTEDLEYFYPTDVLVTAYDIIFFWVARMIFSGIHNMNEVPFKNVLIHGIIRDQNGVKMSKSLGNVIDPLDVIDNFGTDALRYALITGNAAGNDSRYKPERVEASRNFANKIWNASRFVMMYLDKDLMIKYKDCKDYSIADKYIMSRVNDLTKDVTENIDKFELGIAAGKVYDFIWSEFCDWYIELVKPVLYGNDEKEKGISMNVLYNVLIIALKLLHPAMPFITEEIYQHLIEESKGELIEEAICISKWPEYNKDMDDKKSEAEMNIIIDAIKAIRNVRSEMNVPHSKKAKLIILTSNDVKSIFSNNQMYFEKLASAASVEFINSKEEVLKNVASAVTNDAQIYLPLAELIDIDKEIDRLNKEKDRLISEIDRGNKKLANEKFVAKAPKELVNEEREKLEKNKAMLQSVSDRIISLK